MRQVMGFIMLRLKMNHVASCVLRWIIRPSQPTNSFWNHMLKDRTISFWCVHNPCSTSMAGLITATRWRSCLRSKEFGSLWLWGQKLVVDGSKVDFLTARGFFYFFFGFNLHLDMDHGFSVCFSVAIFYFASPIPPSRIPCGRNMLWRPLDRSLEAKKRHRWNVTPGGWRTQRAWWQVDKMGMKDRKPHNSESNELRLKKLGEDSFSFWMHFQS